MKGSSDCIIRNRALELIKLSFRDNEVLPTDAFSLMLEDLKKKGIDSKNINLEPLSLNDVNHLVSDTLHLEKKHQIKV